MSCFKVSMVRGISRLFFCVMTFSMAFSKKRALHHLANILSYTNKKHPSRASVHARVSHLLVALDPTADIALMGLDLSAANTREEVMDAFAKANPDLSKEELEAFADNWEKNKDVVKDKAEKAAAAPLGVEQVRDVLALSYNEIKAGMVSPRKIQERLAFLLPSLSTGKSVTAGGRSVFEDFEEDLIHIERMCLLFIKDSIRMDEDRMAMELAHIDSTLDDTIKGWHRIKGLGVDPKLHAEVARTLGSMEEILQSQTSTFPVEVARGIREIVNLCDDIQKDLGDQFASLRTAAYSRLRPQEVEIKTVWEDPSGDPVEVILSGFVSPISPATFHSPAEGGVEDVSMTDLRGNPIKIPPRDLMWAVDELQRAFERRY